MNHLIACPIFREELDAVLPSRADLTIHYLDPLVHNDALKMLQELEAATSSIKNGKVRLLVGRECFCEVSISGFADSINAKVIDEKNCIEAILGIARTEELQKDRTTIHTRGWMEMICKLFQDDPLSGDSVRIMLGHFDKIVLLDYGIKSFSDEEILSYFDLLQVPIEIEVVQLNYFGGVLSKLLK